MSEGFADGACELTGSVSHGAYSSVLSGVSYSKLNDPLLKNVIPHILSKLLFSP